MSSRSSATHLWKRPISIRKNSLAPSVSFVTAEPQQPRSLASAAANLPAILRKTTPPGPYEFTPMTTKNHDQVTATTETVTESPVDNVPHESEQPNSAPEEPIPTTPPVAAPDQAVFTPPDQLTTSVDQSPANPSLDYPQHSVPPYKQQSVSYKRSWFSLLSWSAEQETSTEVKIETSCDHQTPDTVNICTETCGELPKPDPYVKSQHASAISPVRDPETQLAIQSFPEETVSRPHEEISPPSSLHLPTVSRPNPVEVEPSSAREAQILPPELSQNGLSPNSPSHQATDGTKSPTPPDSATSVFAFKFPLLARSKPLLDRAAASPSRDPEPSIERSPEIPIATDTPVPLPITVEAVEPVSADPASAAPVSECGNQTSGQSATVVEVQTNTWWSYVGWSGGSAAGQLDAAVQSGPTGACPAQSPSSDHTDSAQPQPPPSPEPTPTQPESEIKPEADQNLDVNVTESPLPGTKPSPSVLNADIAVAPQSSTWYSPWSWYQSEATVAVTSDVGPGPGQDQTEQPGQAPESEQRAGDHVPVVQPTPDEVSSTQERSTGISAMPSDLIQSTVPSNRSGWMSFFAARAMAMKAITYEKEGGEMEVMDIDDDETSGPIVTPSPPPPPLSPPPPSMVTQPPPTKVTKPPVQAHPPDIQLSSPLPKKPEDKPVPIPRAVTSSDAVLHDVMKRQPSPSPSKISGIKTPISPPPPNLVLPSWDEVFHSLPRSAVAQPPPSVLCKTLQYVSGVLFSKDELASNKGKGKAKEMVYSPYDKALPRAWDVRGGEVVDVLRGCKRVVVIGVHGWFPGAVLRTFAGEPTGTSAKLVNGIAEALELFQEQHKVKLEKVTKIPLEGEGTINRRVDKLYQNLIGNKEWMDDLRDADAIFVATHSQGSVVSTHLLDRLIADRHIRTVLNTDASIPASGIASGSVSAIRPPQRICCLALCGIHLGPLRYLKTSSLVQPYIQYFESTAARELFEFQNTDSAISRDHVRALRNVLNNGTKMVYIASLNDQVVGLYSGLFTCVSHPLILRALYIDGDAYHPSDFLSKLLVLLLRIRNAGFSDGGLLTHLSEATAGSLNGIGHSTPYAELATYSLAIDYLFLTDSGSGAQVELAEEPFSAMAERNDYEIPWALRDLIADDRVAGLFSEEFVALRDALRDWHPKTTILRDVKRKLQPIQRLSSTMIASHASAVSKL